MKRIFTIIILILCGLMLTACGCQHEWEEATCSAPKTCSLCGKTEGELISHTWKEATCTAPKICSVCGHAEGEALGHSWETATCTQAKTCKLCQLSEGAPTEHTPGEWVIEKEAYNRTPGQRTQLCQDCGKSMEEESIPAESYVKDDFLCLSPEELCRRINWISEDQGLDDITAELTSGNTQIAESGTKEIQEDTLFCQIFNGGKVAAEIFFLDEDLEFLTDEEADFKEVITLIGQFDPDEYISLIPIMFAVDPSSNGDSIVYQVAKLVQTKEEMFFSGRGLYYSFQHPAIYIGVE